MKKLYNGEKSDHAWRSYDAEYQENGKAPLSVRVASYNIGGRFHRIEALDTYNNPWGINETDAEYLQRFHNILNEITNSIIPTADIICLQEANGFEQQTHSKKHVAAVKSKQQEEALTKSEKDIDALVIRYQSIWDKMGYELLVVERKVDLKALHYYKSHPRPAGDKRDGWTQNFVYLFNKKKVKTNGMDPKLIFRMLCENANHEQYSKYRGVLLRFIDIKSGRPFDVGNLHLDRNTSANNNQHMKVLLESQIQQGVPTFLVGDTNTTPGDDEEYKLTNPHVASHLECKDYVNGTLTIIDDRSGHVRALDGAFASPTSRGVVVVRETAGQCFEQVRPGQVICRALRKEEMLTVFISDPSQPCRQPQMLLVEEVKPNQSPNTPSSVYQEFQSHEASCEFLLLDLNAAKTAEQKSNVKGIIEYSKQGIIQSAREAGIELGSYMRKNGFRHMETLLGDQFPVVSATKASVSLFHSKPSPVEIQYQRAMEQLREKERELVRLKAEIQDIMRVGGVVETDVSTHFTNVSSLLEASKTKSLEQ